jgi:hypothetical protein
MARRIWSQNESVTRNSYLYFECSKIEAETSATLKYLEGIIEWLYKLADMENYDTLRRPPYHYEVTDLSSYTLYLFPLR